MSVLPSNWRFLQDRLCLRPQIRRPPKGREGLCLTLNSYEAGAVSAPSDWVICVRKGCLLVRQEASAGRGCASPTRQEASGGQGCAPPTPQAGSF